MSICVAIRENELADAAELFNGTDFKFKCLYDSSNVEEYHIEELQLDKLRDCNIFAQSQNAIRNLKMKNSMTEATMALRKIVDAIIEDERHLAILNDYIQYQNIVLVLSNKYIDRAGTKGSNASTLTDSQLDILINEMANTLFLREGLKIYSLNEYRSGVNVNGDIDKETFNERQRSLMKYDEKSFTSDLYNKFEEAFKFRLITYYCKIRQYSLDDVMRQLNRIGALDDRFKEDIYVYEEEAKRLLAKRLCTISFKNDIELLIKRGIISADKLQYDIGLNI